MGHVAILGAGSWGIALGRSLAHNGHQVLMWEIDPEEAGKLQKKRQIESKLPGVQLPESVKVSCRLDEVVAEADRVVIAVPSRFFTETLTGLQQTGWPFEREALLVIATKGLLYPGGRRLSVEANRIFGEKTRFVVLSGPSHAEEVGRDLPTTLVAASPWDEASERTQCTFMTPRLRVYTNSDVIGVEIGGALKNVLAIATGISDGLGFGDNSRAALITRGLRELIYLGVQLGGQRNTFQGLTGLGDLVATCTSRHSRNRRLGELIGQKIAPEEALQQIGMVAEGYYTARNILSLEQDCQLELPICREVYSILYEGKSPSVAVSDLMLRQRKAEDDF